MKIIRYLFAVLTVFVVSISVMFAQQNPTSVVPSQTDSNISTFDTPHMAWLPTSSPRGELLLFLTGTNGIPMAKFPFLNFAASLGYHVIELSYPDNVAAQQVCSRSSDPDAYIKFRLEIIEGGNLSALIHVEPADSIENRLQKLLIYLSAFQPNYGWRQFLNNNDKIAWNKICVSGHSQGGGHAYVISKFYEVARVIMTGSPKDYSLYFGRPARGFDTNTKTPLTRYFAFNDSADNIAFCNHAQQMEILQQMGLTKFGVADADRPIPFYNYAHIIVTNVHSPNMTPLMLHMAPLSPKIPACPPVWRYMLTEPVQ